MLKRLLSTALVFAFLRSFTSDIYAGEIITIILPAGTSTRNSHQVIKGKVDEPFVTKLNLVMEPFLGNDSVEKFSRSITVRDGYFSEKVQLYKGLNIIKLSSLGGKVRATKAIFLVTNEKSPHADIPVNQWGKDSPIVLTSPHELILNEPLVHLKGVVTSEDIKLVEIVSMDTLSFFAWDVLSGKQKEDRSIIYKEVAVNNMQFDSSVSLYEGLNIIMAKPADKKAGLELVRIKTVIYEKVNDKIHIESPVVSNGEITVVGMIKDSSISHVQMLVTALVEDFEYPGKIYPKIIADKGIKVKKDGIFSTKVTLQDKKTTYIIKSPPLITVYSGVNRATRTVVKWW